MLRHPHPGLLVAAEGIDGAGKTCGLRKLAGPCWRPAADRRPCWPGNRAARPSARPCGTPCWNTAPTCRR